jgi:hypothetical protein
VLTCADLVPGELAALVGHYGLRLAQVGFLDMIPGSYWGDSEAGLMDDTLWTCADTPVHSALHETGHYVCMNATRRRSLHTDAGGDDLEECAVCYLQILLADYLSGVHRGRMMRDMDCWGYSFRLGCTRAWFDADAQDACEWLHSEGLVDADGTVTFRLRGSPHLR